MRSFNFLTKCCAVLTTGVFVLFTAAPAGYALPEGGTVQSGSSTITTTDTAMNITQGTQKSIINWNSYNIAGNEAVNYHQPSSSALSLNRVTGGSASEIFGALNANGRVWLVNPSGIMFGPTSSVNTAGLLASNLNISNTDFLNNNFIFSKVPGADGYVINKGELTAADGGYISLLGDSVVNEGMIQARLGKAILSGGEKMTLEMDADGMISVAINESISRAGSDENGTLSTDAVSNTGTIEADGGSVVLTASVLGDVFENAVNNSGLVKASSLVDHDGEIYLRADGADARVKNTGVLDVSASENGAAGGYIEICADAVSIDGSVHAQGLNNLNGEVYIDPWDVWIRSSDPGVGPGDSYIAESFLESSTGSYSIVADNDVSFSLVDSHLDLDGFGAGTSFNVSAGRHIDLNDTSIETSGGSVFLRADDVASFIDGEGDVILGSGSAIMTDGGDIGLHGANISLYDARLNSSIDSSGASVDIVIEARHQIVPSELELPISRGGDISIVDSIVNASVRSDGSSRISINTDNGDIDIASDSFLSASVGGDGTADLFVSSFTLGDVKGFVTIDNSRLSTHVGTGKAYTNIEGKNDVSVSADSQLQAFSWTDAEVRVESVSDIYMRDSSVHSEVFADGDAFVNINLNPWYEDTYEQNTTGDFIISNTDLIALVGNDGTAEVNVNAEGDVRITDKSLLLAQIGMGATTAHVNITSNYGDTITVDDSELRSEVLYTNGVARVTLRSDYEDSGSVIVKNGAKIKAITADGAPETGQDAFVGLVGHTIRVENSGTQLVALNNGDGSAEVRLNGNNDGVYLSDGASLKAQSSVCSNPRGNDNATGDKAMVGVYSNNRIDVDSSIVEANVLNDGTAWIQIEGYGANGEGYDTEITNSTIRTFITGSGHGDIDLRAYAGDLGILNTEILSFKNSATEGTEIELRAGNALDVFSSGIRSIAAAMGEEHVELYSNTGNIVIDDSTFIADAGNEGTARVLIESTNADVIIGQSPKTILAEVDAGNSDVRIVGLDVDIEGTAVRAESERSGSTTNIHLEAFDKMYLKDSSFISLGSGFNGGSIKVKIANDDILNSLLNDSAKNVTLNTQHLMLEAGGSIGTSDAPILTNANILSAVAHGGGVYITDNNSSGRSNTQISNAEAYGSTVAITTNSNTIINDVFANGDGGSDPAIINIRVHDGNASVVGTVEAHNVSDGNAHIAIEADRDVNVSSSTMNARVTGTGDATIVLKSRGMSEGETGRNITLYDSSISAIPGGDGFSEINLLAPSGSIESETSFLNAQYLGAFANKSIGSVLYPIEMDVDVLAAYSSGTGDMYFRDSSDLEVGTVIEDSIDSSPSSEGGAIAYEFGLSVAANDGIINILTTDDMLVNSVVSPRGGVYLESSEGSIFAGEGWCPALDQRIPAADFESRYINEVKESSPISVAATEWDTEFGIDTFYPIMFRMEEGPNVMAGGYSYFSAPSTGGTIGVGAPGDVIDPSLLSGQVQGIVSPGDSINAKNTPEPSADIDISRVVPGGPVLYQQLADACVDSDPVLPPGGLEITRPGGGSSGDDDVDGPVKQIWPEYPRDPETGALIIPSSDPVFDGTQLQVHVRVLDENSNSAVPERFTPKSALTLEIGNFLKPGPDPDPDPDGSAIPLINDNLRFRIPKKERVDTFTISHTQGPDALAAGQVYFYHPLFEMQMYETPALGVDAYQFIDDSINTTSPALMPLLDDREE